MLDIKWTNSNGQLYGEAVVVDEGLSGAEAVNFLTAVGDEKKEGNWKAFGEDGDRLSIDYIDDYDVDLDEDEFVECTDMSGLYVRR